MPNRLGTLIGLFSVALATCIMLQAPTRAQSGLIEQTCDRQQAAHYDRKALDFMQGQKWSEATWAFGAAVTSIARCETKPQPLWYYVTSVELATAYYNMHNYKLSLRYLSIADSWKPQAQSNASAGSQAGKWFTSLSETTDKIRDAIANIASTPQTRLISVPVPAQRYGGGNYRSTGCTTDSIEDVASDGRVIKTLGGRVYLVADIDTVDTNIWLVADDLLICSTSDPRVFRLINKDDRMSEPAYATLAQ